MNYIDLYTYIVSVEVFLGNWEELFSVQQHQKRMYPESFVLRAFLSQYPLRMVNIKPGQRVLDLSCGYGRNLVFLQSLGLEVFATEITESFVQQLQHDFPKVSFSRGTCQSLPFQSDMLDGVMACNSCYYLDGDASFRDNLQEIFRVLKPKGFFLGSMVASRHSLIVGSPMATDGSVVINAERLNGRNSTDVFKQDQRIQTCSTAEDLENMLTPFATNIHIGSIEDKLGAVNRHLWYFSCIKRGVE